MNELRKRSDPKLALIIIAAIVYVLSPLDFIPDIAPIIGWLDDAGVIAFTYKRYKAYKRERSLGHSSPEILDAPLKALE